METLCDTGQPLAEAVLRSPVSILDSLYMSIPWDIVVVTYCLIFFDLFYGVVISTIKHETVSHKMLKGLKNKTFVMCVPIIGIIMKAFFTLCSLPEEWAGHDTINGLFGVAHMSEFPICLLLCMFVILMEFLSFLENSAKIDGRAKRLLDIIQRKTDDDDVKSLLQDDEDLASEK